MHAAIALQTRMETIGLRTDCVAPIPAPDPKKQVLKHSGAPWNADKLRSFPFEHGEGVGVMLDDLVVLDCDNARTVEMLAAKFPILSEAPTVVTPNGRHFYFRRPSSHDLVNRNGPFVLDGDTVHLYIRTRTSTRNVYGIVRAPPTEGYAWVDGRSIFDVAPSVMPDDLASALAHLKTPPPKSVARGHVEANGESDAEHTVAEPEGP